MHQKRLDKLNVKVVHDCGHPCLKNELVTASASTADKPSSNTNSMLLGQPSCDAEGSSRCICN